MCLLVQVHEILLLHSWRCLWTQCCQSTRRKRSSDAYRNWWELQNTQLFIFQPQSPTLCCFLFGQNRNRRRYVSLCDAMWRYVRPMMYVSCLSHALLPCLHQVLLLAWPGRHEQNVNLWTCHWSHCTEWKNEQNICLYNSIHVSYLFISSHLDFDVLWRLDLDSNPKLELFGLSKKCAMS